MTLGSNTPQSARKHLSEATNSIRGNDSDLSARGRPSFDFNIHCSQCSSDRVEMSIQKSLTGVSAQLNQARSDFAGYYPE
jgi:hypothetical protein